MKITISGYYGFDNFGDEAILATLVNHIKNFNSDITVFSSNPQKTSEKLDVNSINSFDIKNVINQLKFTDILISGGGSLLQDVTSLKSLIYYLFVIFVAIIFNKKVLIFAQGIGPINNCLARKFTAFILKHCSYVSVRDKKSQELLESWNIKSELVCDPIFSLELPKYEPEKIIGVQLRQFSTMNETLLKTILTRLKNEFFSYKVRVISFQDSVDLEICKKFIEMLRDENISHELVYCLNQQQIIESLSKCEYLIAMRFHALILALKYGIKSIGINYDIKIEKLAKDCNLNWYSMDGTNNPEFKIGSCDKTFDWTNFDKQFS